MLKYFIIIELFIVLFIVASTFAVVIVARTNIKNRYPNAQFRPNPNSMIARLLLLFVLVLKALIPIYNLIVVCGFLFMWDALVEQAEQLLLERKIEEE